MSQQVIQAYGETCDETPHLGEPAVRVARQCADFAAPAVAKVARGLRSPHFMFNHPTVSRNARTMRGAESARYLQQWPSITLGRNYHIRRHPAATAGLLPHILQPIHLVPKVIAEEDRPIRRLGAIDRAAQHLRAILEKVHHLLLAVGMTVLE